MGCGPSNEYNPYENTGKETVIPLRDFFPGLSEMERAKIINGAKTGDRVSEGSTQYEKQKDGTWKLVTSNWVTETYTPPNGAQERLFALPLYSQFSEVGILYVKTKNLFGIEAWQPANQVVPQSLVTNPPVGALRWDPALGRGVPF